MPEPKFIRCKAALAAAFFICLFAFNSLAQQPVAAAPPQNERNYEVVLQVISATNNAGDRSNTDVPASLAGVVKKLKTMYSFSNYRVNLTYLLRVADASSSEFKGVASGSDASAYAPIFSEFSVGRLSAPDHSGQNLISIDNFRYGQRVPVRAANFTDEGGGKSNAVINYEQTGLTMRKIGLTLNTPTIIGNLSAAKFDEFSFLILTVKQTD